MAGQMIVSGFRGDTAAKTATLAKMIGQGRLGGVMYLKTNVRSLDDVAAMNAQFRAAGAPLAPLIALDQEGGQIERLTHEVGFPEVPSAATLGQAGDVRRAEALYSEMARGLAELGFNVNFGPVVDINVNPDNPVIARYGRAYGNAVETVDRFGAAFVEAHRAAHVLTVLKHFPGHGSSSGDSHKGFVDISKTWQTRELDPFRDLIADGLADMIMVGHLYHFGYGSDGKVPASLSPEWIDNVLRKQLRFEGVVITDDLEMGAIRQNFDRRDAVLRAVRAGVDLLLFSNTADYREGLADEIRGMLVDEARRDPAFAARLKESYLRIVALKSHLRRLAATTSPVY